MSGRIEARFHNRTVGTVQRNGHLNCFISRINIYSVGKTGLMNARNDSAYQRKIPDCYSPGERQNKERRGNASITCNMLVASDPLLANRLRAFRASVTHEPSRAARHSWEDGIGLILRVDTFRRIREPSWWAQPRDICQSPTVSSQDVPLKNERGRAGHTKLDVIMDAKRLAGTWLRKQHERDK